MGDHPLHFTTYFKLICVIFQLIAVIVMYIVYKRVKCYYLNRPPPHPTPTSPDAVSPPPGAQMNQVFNEPDPIQLFNLQRLNYPQMPAQPLSYSPPRSYSPPPSYTPPPSYSSLSIKQVTDV